jgi:hypothetical protein
VKAQDADVVCQLRQRTVPLPSRLRILCARVRKCRLGDEQIHNAADALSVAPTRDALRFRRAGEQISRSAHAISGCFQIVIRREHLQSNLLTRLLGTRVRGVELI